MLPEELAEKLKQSASSRKRMLFIGTTIYVIIFLGGGIMWLWYTKSTIDDRQAQLDNKQERVLTLEDELSTKQNELDSLQIKVQNLNLYLEKADNFIDNVVSFDDMQFKHIGTKLGPEQGLFFHLKELQWEGIKFNNYGMSFVDGMNSPALMSHILLEHGIIQNKYRDAMDLVNYGGMPITNDEPSSGDIVVYESGYTMLFIGSSQYASEFVIGMTPYGILQLEVNFAQLKYVLRPKY